MKIIRGQIKFETIKQRAKDEFNINTSRGGGWPRDEMFLVLLPAIEALVKPWDMLDEWAAAVINIIDKWDVRCVGKLIELFPTCIPKRFHGLPMRADIADNEKRGWIICFGV